MASIRKHRGKWQARVRRDGVAVTKTFTLRKDANAWAREIETKADRALLPPNTRVRRLSYPGSYQPWSEEGLHPQRSGLDEAVLDHCSRTKHHG